MAGTPTAAGLGNSLLVALPHLQLTHDHRARCLLLHCCRVFALDCLGFGWSDKPLIDYHGVWPQQIAGVGVLNGMGW